MTWIGWCDILDDSGYSKGHGKLPSMAVIYLMNRLT